MMPKIWMRQSKRNCNFEQNNRSETVLALPDHLSCRSSHLSERRLLCIVGSVSRHLLLLSSHTAPEHLRPRWEGGCPPFCRQGCRVRSGRGSWNRIFLVTVLTYWPCIWSHHSPVNIAKNTKIFHVTYKDISH